MKIKRKPYHLLLLTGLILVLTSFFVFDQTSTIDIHLRDTYFVIANSHILWLLAILLLFLWTFYLVTDKTLYSKFLTWAHVIFTILMILVLVLTLFWGESFINHTPRRYYDSNDWNSFNAYVTLNETIGITILVFLFGQFIVAINFLTGLFKRRSNDKT